MEGQKSLQACPMFYDDFPIVIWTIVKKNSNYILLDSCGIEVFRRKENRKQEIYQYCEKNGIDYQEEF
jgi:hypothetical protein